MTFRQPEIDLAPIFEVKKSHITVETDLFVTTGSIFGHFPSALRRKLCLTLDLSNPPPWIVRARLPRGFTHATKLAVSNNSNITGKDLHHALATRPTLQALCSLENPQIPLSVVPVTIKAITDAPDTMHLTELSRKQFDDDLEHYNAEHTKHVRALASSRFSTLLARSLQ